MATKKYQNESGGVVEAYVVTDATEGKVQTVSGYVLALAGDVVVPSQNASYVDVYPGKEFFNTYREVTDDELADQEANTVVAQGQSVQPGFDPNTKTAAQVRDYLANVKSRDEYERVSEAERNGRNRSTAVPEREWDDE